MKTSYVKLQTICKHCNRKFGYHRVVDNICPPAIYDIDAECDKWEEQGTPGTSFLSNNGSKIKWNDNGAEK